jgi:hypothetical protein
LGVADRRAFLYGSVLMLTAPLAGEARPRSRGTRKTEERKNANNFKTP